ncbi:aspartate carbamoyltransferase catalytic subunit [Thermodesulfobacteriota bacterium]
MGINLKHLIDIESITKEEALYILDSAQNFLEISTREIKKLPTLRGKTVINLFFENSTRTRTSFELAGKRLSADTINISASTSAVSKGETLLDTLSNLEAMRPDVIILRHPASGAANLLAKNADCAVINAGDGQHAHPTQALLDLMTIRSAKGRLDGLKVTIVGDIKRSRVARSNINLLNKVGCDVSVCAPATMIPAGLDKLGVKVFYDIKSAITDADVVMMLRIQKERGGKNLFPSIREYSKYFSLNKETIKYAKKDVTVMHPGPINRGVEISSDIADGPYSVILPQVTNGLALRMAILFILAGGSKHE